MKKVLALLVLFLGLNSFKSENLNTLDCVNHINKLNLKFIDDKFGEWGGDEKQVVVYRDDLNGPILADCYESIMSYPDPSRPKKNNYEGRMKLSQKQIDLVVKSIEELVAQKINKKSYPSHAGLYCETKLSDSSLVIKVFPAKTWVNFNQLWEELKKNKNK